MEDPPQLIETALSLVSNPSTKERVSLFSRISSWIGNGDLDVGTAAGDLVSLVFRTLATYDDRASTVAVEGAIGQGLRREPAFVKLFASALLQANEKLQRPVGYGVDFRLLRWSCLLIRSSPETLASKTASAKLVALQSSLVTRLFQGNGRLLEGAIRILEKLLSQQPGVFAQYVSQLKAAPVSLENCGMVGVLLRFRLGSKTDTVAAEDKAFFMDSYSRLVLSSREKPPEFLKDVFLPLIKAMDREEFSNTVAPVATKMLKRNPEVIMAAIDELIGSVSIDMSRFAADFLVTLLQQARHLDESKRAQAIVVVQRLAEQCSDFDVLNGLFRTATAVLGGSEGKLTAAYQRVGVIRAIGALSRAPSGKGGVLLGKEVSLFLLSAYKSEGNEEVKVGILSALALWLARPGNDIPSEVEPFFLAGLKEKETLRRAHFRCLRVAFKNESMWTKMGGLVDTLVQLLKGGATKATQRVEAVYSLLLLARIAMVDVSADDRLVKEKVWSLVLQKDTPLLYPGLLLKLQQEDWIAVADLIDVLLLHHALRVAEQPEGAALLFQLEVSVLWHPIWELRKIATATVGKCRSAVGDLSEALFDAFTAWLPMLEDRLVSQKSESADNVDAKGEAKDTATPSPQLAARALLEIASPSMAAKPGVASRMMLAAHHPFLVGHCAHKSLVWEHLVNKLRHAKVNLPQVLGSDAGLVCKILLGAGGLASARPSDTTAAIHAVGSALRNFPKEIFPYLIPSLEALGDRTSHDALSTHDIKVYNTPEGVLSTDDGVYVAQVVRDKNVRLARGRMRMYDDLDEDDEGPPAKELSSAKTSKEIPRTAAGGSKGAAKKDGGKPGGKKAGDGEKAKSAKEEAREAQLQEETAIRERIRGLKAKLELTLGVIAYGAEANQPFMHDHLPELSDYVLPLLKSPLVSAAAFSATLRLGTCLVAPLKCDALHIACALNLVQSDPAALLAGLKISLSEPKGKREPGEVEKVVEGLARACKDGALPTASFSFVFPVLEKILLASTKTRLHDQVLGIISLHSSPGLDLPRLRMIKALYHVLGCVPVYYDKLLPVLRDLCRGLTASHLGQALGGVYAQQANVRVVCLEAVKCLPALRTGTVPHDAQVRSTLWMATFDPEQGNRALAEDVWDMYDVREQGLGEDYAAGLILGLSHANLNVRQASSYAIAAAMYEYPTTVQGTLSALFALYNRDTPIGRGDVDPTWPSREGVAMTLQAAHDVLTSRDLSVVFTFLISKALADPNSDVRQHMVEAGSAIIDRQGKDNVGLLLPIFENYLNKKAVDEERYDLVREGVVVFLGALAKHLSSNDPKVSTIVERLLEVLNTPSEAVQRAVSNCLPPLMPSDEAAAKKLVDRLLERLLKSDKYGERRGAAFGLAAAVKGLELSSLKHYGVMDALTTAIKDTNSAKAREGALLAFECLCEKLGRLFEPYVIRILPLLLTCFGDPVLAVRDATDTTSKAVMGQLTGAGVKLVLPALLKGLDDKAWRTKQGSVQLLGAMAYCAPKQLSACLPTIVPKLSEVLTDTHPKVQSAAQLALQQVGSVIRNPEIAALVPMLLVGIADPNEHTKSSLEELLQTTFVNSVDAPSLALLVPIVHRGLRERSAETKKKAAQIVGNMCSLVTEHKDMLPYLELLLPELKKVLVDPIPEVRTVASRALGSLIKGMGDENFQDLVPWLLEMLKSDASNVERSGAAQGLSEVLAALGTAYFEKLLPGIIANCSHQRATVRDGYLTLFKYLPTAFGPRFQKYLHQVLPAILDGLADENESVRDAALSDGHVFVEHYATTSLPLLLPAVEEGIFNDNWRIRQSSVELLGDLLFKVAGTSGKVVLEGGSDDEGASTEAHGRAIVEVLGREKRDEVLAAVYMIRSDVTLSVRQAALHVWKTIVSNTPRTLKEIMPTLMKTLITSLASPSLERRQVAGRSLGELVRKLGERVMASIIPILRKGLDDPESSTRQGVCMGLSEVMASAGRQQLQLYTTDLIITIRLALCDSSAEVREAAGFAFGTLYRSTGMSVVDEIVPALLQALEEEETSHTALDGLKQILSVRTGVVLPHILPKLVSPPISAFNAHAVGALADVAGPSLNAHLSVILPPLIAAMSSENEEVARAARKGAETVVMAVDEDGQSLLLSELQKGLADPQASVRSNSAQLLGHFCKSTKLDLEDDVPSLLSTLIVMLTDPDANTVEGAWGALSCMTSTLPKESMPTYIKVARDAISTARDKERRKRKAGPILIPGLCLPKALQPVLPIYLQGLMSGSADLREQAAEGLGELIDVTSEAAFKPFVITVTGPLIRIIGDRFPWQVKSAILSTLTIVIGKGGVALKPFLPQLQTTFVKCLQDSTRTVRSRAATALGRLMSLNARVDTIVSDLLGGLQGGDPGVKEAMLTALRGVMLHTGKNVTAPYLAKLVPALREQLGADVDNIRGAAARTLGISAQFLADPDFDSLLQSLTADRAGSWTLRHGAMLAISSLLRHATPRVAGNAQHMQLTLNAIKLRAKDDKVPVRESVAKSTGRLLQLQAIQPGSTPQGLGELLPVLGALLNDESSDVRRQGLGALKAIAKSLRGLPTKAVAAVGPILAERLKDPNQPVKVAAERCALHVFQLTHSPDNVTAAQRFITGLDARRIAKYPEQSDASDDSEGEKVDD